jgi:hypothetical protein
VACGVSLCLLVRGLRFVFPTSWSSLVGQCPASKNGSALQTKDAKAVHARDLASANFLAELPSSLVGSFCSSGVSRNQSIGLSLPRMAVDSQEAQACISTGYHSCPPRRRLEIAVAERRWLLSAYYDMLLPNSTSHFFFLPGLDSVTVHSLSRQRRVNTVRLIIFSRGTPNS